MTDYVALLDLPMQKNDAEAETIRDYLTKLLMTVWQEGESFSGKRPFGNSDWQYDLYKPLIKAGVIKGELDDYDCIEEVDSSNGFDAVMFLIAALGKK